MAHTQPLYVSYLPCNLAFCKKNRVISVARKTLEQKPLVFAYHTSRFSAMKVEFHDTYLIFIIALLWVLCFLRPIITFIGELTHTCINCLHEGCLCCESFQVCGMYNQNILLLLVFLHPVIFSTIVIRNHSTYGTNVTSSIYNIDVENWQFIDEVNSTNSIPSHSTQLASSNTIISTQSIYVVDYLFYALPFALTASFSSMLLVHLSKASLLTEYTVWGDDIDEEVLLYEGAYALELLFLNMSLIAASSSLCTYTEIFFATVSLTLIELYFIATSRYPRHNSTEHNLSAAFLILLCVVCGFIWTQIVNYEAAVTAWVAVVHATITVLVVISHFAAMGTCLARQIILGRIAISIIALLTHDVILAFGRDQLIAK